VLFCNALARCCAPTSSISLPLRCSVVSVCAKKWRCVYEIDEERMKVTVLFCNALARCCAPTARILLPLRCSVVSVCVKKWRCVYEIDEDRIKCHRVIA
jgi:hypothetical protein